MQWEPCQYIGVAGGHRGKKFKKLKQVCYVDIGNVIKKIYLLDPKTVLNRDRRKKLLQRNAPILK